MGNTVYSIAVEEYLRFLVSRCQGARKSDKPEQTHVDINAFLACFYTFRNKSRRPFLNGCQRLWLHDIGHCISLGEKAFSLAVLDDREIESSSGEPSY
jgi:hypothetical protein